MALQFWNDKYVIRWNLDYFYRVRSKGKNGKDMPSYLNIPTSHRFSQWTREFVGHKSKSKSYTIISLTPTDVVFGLPTL